MYRIGICDDEMEFCTEIEEFVQKYAEKEEITVETEVFTSGEEFFQAMSNEKAVDLLFLDIELGGIDGVEVGRRLREKVENEAMQIVYVSSKESYAMQLFQIRPFDFLTKPVNMEKISKVMSEYKRLFIDRNMFFSFQVGKSTYRISENEILYFQCEGKKIQVITTKDKREYYGKMADVEKQISMNKFCVVHKSYIVNINYVSEFCPDEVVMCNEIRIPISQSMRKRVREKILEWNIQGRE